MYKIEWMKDKNIPRLNDFTDDSILPPRPVYYEELDLLGFNKYWNYPKLVEPLLWAIGRDYYFNGEKIGKTIGSDLYNAPKLEVYTKNISIIPINLKELVQINKKHIETLKNEAIEFIKKIYNDYKNRVDFFVVAFSGGKDSQVLLDLVTIALEPNQYRVIFTDTTMELPHTYNTVEETQKYYQKIYSDFKITTVRNPTDAEELWGVFGPPSNMIRWCCNVYKTAPVQNYLKSIKKKLSKIILFDGVRNDESIKRSNYSRISTGKKHLMQQNISPIISWNSFEIWIYLFYANININKEYRIGLARVGCSICPFSSEKTDFIINNKYPNIANKFLKTIEKYTINRDIKDKENYIKDGKWKLRLGGIGIKTTNNINFKENKNDLSINLRNSNENIFEWLKVLGDYKINHNRSKIEIKIDNKILNINYKKDNKNEVLFTKKEDIITISHLKKVAYKTSYCVHCGSCEAECPTGALSVFPKVQVDTNLCIHCSKCLDFHNKGCVMANSAHKTEKKNKTKGLSGYNNFGFRKQWLIEVFYKEDKWFISNQLNVKNQFPPMKRWLREAELLERKNNIFTNLFYLLNDKNIKFVYEILLINLYYNSNLIKWYLDTFSFSQNKLSRNEFIILAKEHLEKLSNDMVKNIVGTLFNLFKESPLGNELKIGLPTIKGKNIRYIQKIGSNNISNEAIVYSLYKLKENLKRDDFRVSEFYKEDFKGGPYKIFGIDKEVLIQKLKFISEDTKLIDVNLIQGLDNIFLKDFTALEVLEDMLK